MKPTATPEGARPPAQWALPRAYSSRTLGLLLVCLAGLFWTGMHVEVDHWARETLTAAGKLVGLQEESKVVSGMARLGAQMWPPAIAQRTPLERRPDLDRERLPWLASIQEEEFFDVTIDYETLEQDITVTVEATLVEPLGYLWLVLRKMVETLEIALWGTLLAVLISAPLAYFSARNYSPARWVYGAARAVVSFLRAMPDLITALFFVLAYGFGPVAGVLALGFHCAGFLGKFYAEDIENADQGPQDALRALGASKLRVLRLAVWPQVMPQYVAYTLYILDRNIRMAAVIGLVGAGGIGQELKGRWDIFDYSHVTTILLVLFLTVFALDQFSARLRQGMIG